MTVQTNTHTAPLDYLQQLRHNGYGLIPLRAKTKAPPQPGLTGDDGQDLTEAQIHTAYNEGRFSNVGIRLPRGVIGLDVDAYEGKAGASTWDELRATAERVGSPIPHTVRITSRADDDTVSGIRLYRATLPDDRKWRGALPGLETIHHGHRYAVCPPSVHPSGRQYVALDEATGELLEIVPSIRSLPRLPDVAVMQLTEPRTPDRVSGPPMTPREVSDDPVRGYTQPCKAVTGRATRARADLTGSLSRHDATVQNVLALARLHEQGHTGALGALDELREAFIHAVTSSGDLVRTVAEAQYEYDTALERAWPEIAKTPTLANKRGCCRSDSYDIPAWEGPPSEATVTDSDELQRDLERAVNTAWDEPLTPTDTHGPPVDISGLPAVVRDMVDAVAAQSQTPREVVLAAALGTLAAATRGVWQVRVNDSWTENTTALFLLTLADSGERKDAGQKPLVRPLEIAEGTIAAEVHRANRNRTAERKRLTAALKAIATDTGGDPRDEAALTEQLHNARERVAPERPFSDVTVEALGMYMSTSGGAAAVFSTEAAAFQTVAGRYSDAGANTSLLNHAYDGEWYSEARVKRAGSRIHRATLTWCTAVQPKVLAGYADQFTEGSGFLNRFALFLPQSMVGRIDWDRDAPVPAHVSAAWAATVGGIHAAAWARYVPMTDDLPDTLGPVPVLSFESDAAEAIRLYGKHLEPRKLPHTPYANLTGWLSKHPGRIVRIAALLALTENPERTTVPLWAVESALTLAEPMIAHALTTYRVLRQTNQNEGAHKALGAVRAIGTDTVTTREVFEKVKGQTSWVTNTADISAALQALVDMGYLRGPYRLSSGGAKGGRPSEVWAVHPCLRHRNGAPVGSPTFEG
jgi:hypothetical protein